MSKNLSHARVSLCSFTFSDGRRCRMPRSATHPYLCYFHGRRENLARAADTVSRQVTACFSGGYVTACDLSTAMAHVFAATARGEIKPRTAGILGYLGQTVVQTIPIAEREYTSTPSARMPGASPSSIPSCGPASLPLQLAYPPKPSHLRFPPNPRRRPRPHRNQRSPNLCPTTQQPSPSPSSPTSREPGFVAAAFRLP
jgi:hypothetical protein